MMFKSVAVRSPQRFLRFCPAVYQCISSEVLSPIGPVTKLCIRSSPSDKFYNSFFASTWPSIARRLITMFEARLTQGVLLRKLLDSMKDLVQVSVALEQG